MEFEAHLGQQPSDSETQGSSQRSLILGPRPQEIWVQVRPRTWTFSILSVLIPFRVCLRN